MISVYFLLILLFYWSFFLFFISLSCFIHSSTTNQNHSKPEFVLKPGNTLLVFFLSVLISQIQILKTIKLFSRLLEIQLCVLFLGTFDIVLCVDFIETTGGAQKSRKDALVKELTQNGERCRSYPGCSRLPLHSLYTGSPISRTGK